VRGLVLTNVGLHLAKPAGVGKCLVPPPPSAKDQQILQFPKICVIFKMYVSVCVSAGEYKMMRGLIVEVYYIPD